MRVGGKMAIDATKPPLRRKNARDAFERVVPSGSGDETLEGILALLRQANPVSQKPQYA